MARVVPDYSGIKRYVQELEDGVYLAKIDASRAAELEEDEAGTYFNLDFVLQEGPEDGGMIGARIYTNGRRAFVCDQLVRALNLRVPFDTVADTNGKLVRIQTKANQSGDRVYVNVWRILPAGEEGGGQDLPIG